MVVNLALSGYGVVQEIGLLQRFVTAILWADADVDAQFAWPRL
jgi:hypothetical protein